MRGKVGNFVGLILTGLMLAGCQVMPILNGPFDRGDRADRGDRGDRVERGDKDAPAGTPAKNSFRVSQYVFHSDFDVPKSQPLFKELGTLRDDVYKELKLPPSNNLVQVYLFETREKYETYMKGRYPDLPKRRAFFVAQPRRLGGGEDLLVFTYWGDRVQQDLRHELTHALLHSVLKDVPLWLDEGLAEFFEMPTAWSGVNYQHVETLRQATVKLDLERLERLSDIQQMSPAEYREAWAWTHLMLRTTPQAKQVLLTYLQELRTNGRPGSMKPRLEKVFVSLDDAVTRHLADLDLARPSMGNASLK